MTETINISKMEDFEINKEIILNNLKYCKIKNRYHYFLIINDNYAISYVPSSSKYIIDKYYNESNNYKPLDQITISIYDNLYTYLGYSLFCFF